MQTPLDVTFRNMDRSTALDAWIHEWVARLEHVAPLQRCAVIIEVPHKHRQRHPPFQVHLTLATPDREFSVTHGAREEIDDPYLAVAEAFRVARRQLVDFVDQRRAVRHADSSKQPGKQNLDLQLAIVKELAWETHVRGSDIGVSVASGVVTLTGTVESWAEKHAAQQAAHRVHGVLGVANDIAIRPSWCVDTTDAELAAAARHALDWHVHVPRNLVIDVWDGVVKLSGVVETLGQREDAEAAIRPLRGLRSIENTIRVEPPLVTEQQLRTTVEDALSRHVGREVKRIVIEVTGGHVKLSGQVDSKLEHDAALGAVIGTRGVGSVEDMLRITR